MDEFMAIIKMFAGNFAPRGWAFCNGQLLSISQNTALFSLLGTNFGGDGVTTFGLPDLRSRVPIHAGQGPGLSSYVIGQVGGVESEQLTINQMPSHQHTYSPLANEGDPNSKVPLNSYFSGNANNFYNTANDGTKMGGQVTDLTGNSQPTSIIQPYTCVNFIICIEGLYPSRN